jgi:hypothetical protein
MQTDFFERYNFFTFVWIRSYLKEIDISGIKFLNSLQRLRMDNKNQGMDFAYFPHLEYASLDWNRKLVNLDKCKKLGRLELRKYNPESKSLHELSRLVALRSLVITQSTILSVDGIENLSNLIELECHYLTKLEDADKLVALSKSLDSLSLSNCKRLKNYAFLTKLTKLKKLKLLSCGSLSNLGFITSMPDLEFLAFAGTNIEDGDLSILAERKIKYVSFDDKKHYSHKMNQINPDFSWKAKIELK